MRCRPLSFCAGAAYHVLLLSSLQNCFPFLSNFSDLSLSWSTHRYFSQHCSFPLGFFPFREIHCFRLLIFFLVFPRLCRVLSFVLKSRFHSAAFLCQSSTGILQYSSAQPRHLCFSSCIESNILLLLRLCQFLHPHRLWRSIAVVVTIRIRVVSFDSFFFWASLTFFHFFIGFVRLNFQLTSLFLSFFHHCCRVSSFLMFFLIVWWGGAFFAASIESNSRVLSRMPMSWGAVHNWNDHHVE